MTELSFFSSAEVSHSPGTELAIAFVLPQFSAHTDAEVGLFASSVDCLHIWLLKLYSKETDLILLTTLSLVSAITPQHVKMYV